MHRDKELISFNCFSYMSLTHGPSQERHSLRQNSCFFLSIENKTTVDLGIKVKIIQFCPLFLKINTLSWDSGLGSRVRLVSIEIFGVWHQFRLEDTRVSCFAPDSTTVFSGYMLFFFFFFFFGKSICRHVGSTLE